MIATLVLAAVTSGPVRQIELDARALRRPVTVECAVGQTTRILLPERIRRHRGNPETEALVGLRVEAHKPKAILVVTPSKHPAQTRLDLTLEDVSLTLVIRTAPQGASGQVEFTLPSSLTAAPAANGTAKEKPPERPAKAETFWRSPGAPAPPSGSSEQGIAEGRPPAPAAAVGKTGSPVAQSVLSVVEPAAAPSSLPPARVVATPAPSPPAPVMATPLLDPEILRARPRKVGRVEALPGQRVVELTDLLEGQKYVWLRFTVRDAKGARVEGISWEHGPVATSTVEPMDDGKQLFIVVQLERAKVTKKTRVSLRLDDGVRKFALSAPWLSVLVKDLVGF